MRPDIIFLICCLALLSGVLYAALGMPLTLAILPPLALFAFLYWFDTKPRLAVLASVLMLAGSAYYYWFDLKYHELVWRVPGTGSFAGLIVSDPKRTPDTQSFVVQTEYGRYLVSAAADPQHNYGEQVTLAGATQPPPDSSYGRYLEKEQVVATMQDPTITVESSGGGNPALAFLYGLKASARDDLSRLLGTDNGGFLYGIMFGTSEGVSKSLSDQLSVSGTKFITAIDGLHMQIVLLILLGVFAWFLPRGWAITLSIACGLVFVALTGFTTSGIRAALMAGVAALAQLTGRRYVAYTALALAAVVLTLLNPTVLLYDVGFQLSFVAVLAILYFLPVLKRFLSVESFDSVLDWKEAVLITIAVQLATAPIVITQFHSFSFTSFVASALVVIVLPFILGLGFLMAIAALLFFPLGYPFALLLVPLLSYVRGIVDLAAAYAVSFNPDLGIIGITLYYVVLLGIIYRFYPRGESTLTAMPVPIEAKELHITEVTEGF